MSMMQNFFTGNGNVGKRIELNTRKDKDGNSISVLNFSMRQAVKRKQADGAYQDVDGFWIDVEQWGKMAEMNHALMQVGCHVYVAGMEYQKTWEMTQGDNAGQTSRSMAVRADYVAFGALGVERIQYAKRAPKPNAQGDSGAMDAASAPEPAQHGG